MLEFDSDYAILKEQLEHVIQHGDVHDATALFDQYHSVDIDEVLEDLEPTDLQFFLFMLNAEHLT